MSRTSRGVLGLGVIGCAALLVAGCNGEVKDLKAHIVLIEDTNLQLTEKLAESERQLDETTRQRDDLDTQLLAARNEAEDLRNQLAQKPDSTPPAEGWQKVPGGAMIAIEGSVLFRPGQAVLRDAGRTTLDAIVSAVNGQYANKDVLVFGHTDDQPIKKSGWKDNYELSCQRALTVVRFLRDRGISPGRLVACGCGEHRPKVPNSNDANRAQNRRVEIFALTPRG